MTTDTTSRGSGTIKEATDWLRNRHEANRYALENMAECADPDNTDKVLAILLAAIQPDPEPQPVAWQDVLTKYRDELCEGFCKEDGWSDRAHCHPDVQRDCSGCLAAAALLSTPSSAGTVSDEAAGWRPIETAPTDGNEFLVAYSDGVIRAGRYLDNSHMPWPWKGVRPLYGVERAGSKITHWMPLPAPPAPCSNGGHE